MSHIIKKKEDIHEHTLPSIPIRVSLDKDNLYRITLIECLDYDKIKVKSFVLNSTISTNIFSTLNNISHNNNIKKIPELLQKLNQGHNDSTLIDKIEEKIIHLKLFAKTTISIMDYINNIHTIRLPTSYILKNVTENYIGMQTLNQFCISIDQPNDKFLSLHLPENCPFKNKTIQDHYSNKFAIFPVDNISITRPKEIIKTYCLKNVFLYANFYNHTNKENLFLEIPSHAVIDLYHNKNYCTFNCDILKHIKDSEIKPLITQLFTQHPHDIIYDIRINKSKQINTNFQDSSHTIKDISITKAKFDVNHPKTELLVIGTSFLQQTSCHLSQNINCPSFIGVNTEEFSQTQTTLC